MQTHASESRPAQRRKHVRYAPGGPNFYATISGLQHGIQDISLGGIAILVPDFTFELFLRPFQQRNVVLNLDGVKATLTVELMNYRPAGAQSKMVRAGYRFVGISPALEEKIVDSVSSSAARRK